VAPRRRRARRRTSTGSPAPVAALEKGGTHEESARCPPRASEPNPIYPVPTAATERQLRELLSSGLSLTMDLYDGEYGYDLGADGLATLETGGIPNVSCARRGTYRVKGRTITFECTLEKRGGDGVVGDRLRRRLSIEIVKLGQGVMEVREDVSWKPWWSAFWDHEKGTLSDAPDMRGRSRLFERPASDGSRAFSVSDQAVAVEFVPGAKDRALFDAVKARASRPPSASGPVDPLQLYLLFEGPPAQTPRVASEVFYVEGAAEHAQEVAEALLPLIGPVRPKPWPGGAWDYEVVVVVGSRRAGTP